MVKHVMCDILRKMGAGSRATTAGSPLALKTHPLARVLIAEVMSVVRKVSQYTL